MTEAALDRGEDLDGLAHHFWADSVAGENHDPRHRSRPLDMPQAVKNWGAELCLTRAGRRHRHRVDQAVRTLGIHSGRRDSYAAILSAWRSVRPMSSNPSSSR